MSQEHTNHIDTYQDSAGEWRWRLSVIPGTPGGEKGNIIADSGEGYKNKKDMLSALFRIFFEAYDESFLALYSEWNPPNNAPFGAQTVQSNDPAEPQA